MLCNLLISNCLIVVSAFSTTACYAVDWHKGNAVKKAALKEISGRWVDAPVRSLLTQLSNAKRIPIFIDRRVDPSIQVTLASNGKNWEQLLAEIGTPHGFGFCRLEGIYYFGPQPTAITLPSQYQKLKDWVIRNRRNSALNWRKSETMSWERLSQPREIFARLAKENGVELHQFDIPFDLWPESELPNVPLLLKAALLSAGFEQWIMISKTGSKLKFVEFPLPETVEYSLMEISNSKRVMSGFVGNVSTRTNGTKLVIKGAVDEVGKAVAFAVKSQTVVRNQVNGASTYTGDLKGKRGAVLATIAQQMSIQFKFDSAESKLLNEHIEFRVDDDEAEDVIEGALRGTGLKYRIENGVLEIYR